MRRPTAPGYSKATPASVPSRNVAPTTGSAGANSGVGRLRPTAANLTVPTFVSPNKRTIHIMNEATAELSGMRHDAGLLAELNRGGKPSSRRPRCLKSRCSLRRGAPCFSAEGRSSLR